MANIPVQRSYSQILGTSIGSFVSRTGIARLKIGNPILSIFEATAQSQLRSSADTFQLLAAINLDNATGQALARIGADENVPKLLARASSGYVNISDTSFEKISSLIYQGTGAPIVGSTSINVSDATDFPASGSVYLGRNTQNYEGPLTYTSKVDNTSYWTLNLSSPTTRFHNLGESVVLAQGGNRTVSAGTIVQTSQGNTVQAVQFKTIYPSILPDGENEVNGVLVVALRVGTTGNIEQNAIQEFVSDPFSGAVATNPNSFSNGRDTETDSQYRERIRVARQTRALGTKLAIKNASLGAFSVSENKSVISSSYVTRINEPDVLYIDDGNGYQEVPVPVSFDTIIASASGGEQYLNVSSPTPVSKGFAVTTLSSPFALIDGAILNVIVGNELSVHTFNASDFKNINSASSFEVVASINGNPSLLFSARSAENSSKVSIFAKQSYFEKIKVLNHDGLNANEYLGFSLQENDTLNLYKNDRLLVKDGAPAVYFSNPFSIWASLSGTQTLIIAIDGTPAITYTFTDSDFIDGNTGYVSLSNNSLEAWETVINSKIPGITCTVAGSALQLESNIGPDARAALQITGGSLVSNLAFDIGEAVGAANDYQFDRNIGQIRLTDSLETGDTLTAGTADSRIFIESQEISTIDLTNEAKLWFGLDTDYSIVRTGIVESSSLSIDYSANTNPWAYRLRIASTAGIFSDVEKDNLVIITDDSIDDSFHGAWRVVDRSDTYVEIDKTNCYARRAEAAYVVLSDGRFLVCGGMGGQEDNAHGLSSAEIYDPVANIWAPIAPMATGRYAHTATLLVNGKVLVVGGYVTTFNETTQEPYVDATNFCELYDPVAGTWSNAAALPTARGYHGAILITTGPNTGNVLVAGGSDQATSYANAYIYNVAGDSWSATASMGTARSRAIDFKVPTGNFLMAGGLDSTFAVLATAEVYDVTAATWAATGNNMSVARYSGNAAVGAGTTVFGGYTTFAASPTVTAVNESYATGSNLWTVLAAAPAPMGKGAWSPRGGGTNDIVAVGGDGTNPGVNTQIYDTVTNTWASVQAPPSDYNYSRTCFLQIDQDHTLVSHGRRAKDDTDLVDFTAVSYIYDAANDEWEYTDPAISSSVTLTDGGIIFADSFFAPVEASVPAGTDYTATSLVNNLDPDIIGADARVYKTNKFRVYTNTQSIENGSIGLIAANADGYSLTLDTSDAVLNTSSHSGSVESGVGEIDVPYLARIPLLGSSTTALDVTMPTNKLDAGYNVLFGKTANDEAELSSASNYDDGQRRWDYTTFESEFNISQERLNVRELPLSPIPAESVDLMIPFKFSPYDTFSVLVDGDSVSKNYDINMWRSLQPQGTTFSTTNTFRDADNSNASLAVAFGFGSNSFDFENFAIHMPARTSTFPATAAKRILYRFRKLGPDGDNSLLEYALPDGPNNAVSQSVLIDYPGLNSKDLIQIKLAGGAAATGISITGITQVGYCCTQNINGLSTLVYVIGLAATNGVRTSNVTTITVALPGAVANHGIAPGSYVYFSGSGSFTAGLYFVTGVTATSLDYAEVGADVASTPIAATISRDTQPTTFVGASPALANGQFFRITDESDLSDNFTESTIRIASSGNQFVSGVVRDQNGNIPVSTTLDWDSIVDPDNLILFANPAQTASAIATAFAESNLDDSDPVNATLTGTGAGTIDRSTAEEEADGSFFYELTDGLHYVRSVTTPVLLTNNYVFTFKESIAPDLATNSDWANETIRIVPVTTQNCVDWLNCTGVTGLGNVSSIQRSSIGQKVQIKTNTLGSDGSVQVLGGGGNAVNELLYSSPVFSAEVTNGLNNWFALKIKTQSSKNLIAGSKVLIQNSVPVYRPGPWATGSGAITISAANGLVISSTDMFPGNSRSELFPINIEKLNSDYVLIHNYEGVIGGWVNIDQPAVIASPNISNSNCGLFRVVDVFNRNANICTLIQNSNAVEEYDVTAGITTIADINSLILPNDYFSINTTTLGIGNIGKRKVVSVGQSYVQLPPSSMTRSGATVTVNTPYAHGFAIGMGFTLSPGETVFPAGIKQILGVPNPTQFTYTEAGVAGTNTLSQIAEGFAFQNNKIFRLATDEISLQSASSIVLTTPEGLQTVVIEGSPEAMIKEIVSIIPSDETDPISGENFSYIKLTPIDDTSLIPTVRASAEAGSSISHLTKFKFPTTISVGNDAYHYSGGLINETAKILYGVETDPLTYPGVIAAGNSVEISGPLIRRVQISLSVRIRAGLPQSSVVNKVRSAVTAVINQSQIGEDIALSDIVEAANRVSGVLSVTIDSPVYNNLNDIITVQTYEKALVIDATTDIQVFIIGS